MSDLKRYILGISLTLSATVTNLFLGFLITLSLSRFLGASDLGSFKLASNIYAIIVLLADIGISSAVLQFVSQYRDDRHKVNSLVSSAFFSLSIIGIIVGILFYFSSGLLTGIFHNPDLYGLLVIIPVIYPFALVSMALQSVLIGLREMKYYAISIVIQSVLMLIITTILLYFGAGSIGAVIGMILSTAGTCLYLVYITFKYYQITFNGCIESIKQLVSLGWKLVLNSAINQINYQADIVLIGLFLTSTQVGYYSIAVSLGTFFWLIPAAVQANSYPLTCDYLNKKNFLSLQLLYDKSMKFTAFVLSFIGLGLYFYSKIFIATLFGPEFMPAALPLVILVIGTVIFGIIKSVGSALICAGRPDLSVKINSICAITNVLLNLLLIPWLGISGAAIATTTSANPRTSKGIRPAMPAFAVRSTLIQFSTCEVYGLMQAMPNQFVIISSQWV